jgi:hypothetical protein
MYTRRRLIFDASRAVIALGATAAGGKFWRSSARATHNCGSTGGPCPCWDPCNQCSGCDVNTGHCPANCSDTGYCWTCAEPDGCTLYCRTCTCSGCNCYCDRLICPFRPRRSREAA